MNIDRNFVRALADYLALHTEQPEGYLVFLIESFLRGAAAGVKIEPAVKDQILARLKADMQAYDDVPSFLQNYLVTHLSADALPPQAAFVASRYLRRRTGERFLAWRQRQPLVAEFEGEPIRGTELGFRQMLYSQGAGPAFRWRGVPCFKSSYDVALYAMLIDELRPATIIELGSGAGGSALLLADLCAASGVTAQIVSVDTAAAQVADPRVSFVQSDCAAWLAATAKAKPPYQRPCLMIEDFHGDLAGFFADIDAILEAGDYLVIEDSYPKQSRIAEAIADRPYLIDTKYTDFFGTNCTSAINSILTKSAGTGTDAAEIRAARRERQQLRDQARAWRQRSRET